MNVWTVPAKKNGRSREMAVSGELGLGLGCEKLKGNCSCCYATWRIAFLFVVTGGRIKFVTYLIWQVRDVHAFFVSTVNLTSLHVVYNFRKTISGRVY